MVRAWEDLTKQPDLLSTVSPIANHFRTPEIQYNIPVAVALQRCVDPLLSLLVTAAIMRDKDDRKNCEWPTISGTYRVRFLLP